MKIVAQNVLLELEDIQSVSKIKESGYSGKYFYVTIDNKPILFEANKMRTVRDRYGVFNLKTLREFIMKHFENQNIPTLNFTPATNAELKKVAYEKLLEERAEKKRELAY